MASSGGWGYDLDFKATRGRSGVSLGFKGHRFGCPGAKTRWRLGHCWQHFWMNLADDQVRPVAASYRLAQLVYACASLGVPDALESGAGTPDEVAIAIGAPCGTVARLLRAAASEGVVSFDAGRYQLNDFSRALRSSAEGSLRDFILGWSALRPGYIAFGYLDQVVTSGKSGLELAFGSRFHDYMRTHPEDASRYEAAMESTEEGFRDAASAYDFSKYRRLVDVGGGQGAFLIAMIDEHSGVQGVLFDLPDVVAGAHDRLAPYVRRGQIEVVGGDMFVDLPPGADAYLFSTVLRCFRDDECLDVLRRCRAQMEPDGRLLALEMVMPEGIPPSPCGLADLQALVVYGGMDRTQNEWIELLREAGFGKPAFHPVDGPYYVIEAAAS